MYVTVVVAVVVGLVHGTTQRLKFYRVLEGKLLNRREVEDQDGDRTSVNDSYSGFRSRLWAKLPKAIEQFFVMGCK